MDNKFKRTRFACFYTYIAMASAFCLPPMLFMTFREQFGISYTLLGTLVLVVFFTQLIIDLIFTFFAKYFNIHKTIRLMPLLTTTGLIMYALLPTFFPQYAYLGLLLGTIIFSVAAGLSEVLLSPLVAAIPSPTPDRDMSFLHSLYAYGVLSVVIISSLYFKIFGIENWVYLVLFFSVLPVISSILFTVSPLPQMNIGGEVEKNANHSSHKGIMLCTLCIFLGSAAENTMTTWISSFMESALNISKAVGDIIGLAIFAILLGLGRTLYAKYGKNISSVLFFGMLGASICYITIGLVNNVIISAFACVLTGICTSMFWPGTLILMEEKIPNVGVAAYALMAAGGDFGGSVAPQMLGIVVDKVSKSGWASNISDVLSITAEQLGMKIGMLTAAIFPLLGVVLLSYMKKYFKK